jgi:hypothetical protein
MRVMSVRRLSLAGVVSSCLIVVGVLFSAPVALAVTSPVVEEVSVLNVAGTSATFQAKIDPEGSETTYRFEYGTSAAYGSKIPIPDGIVGSGSAGITVSAHPQDLSPSTEYHYRVVALVASRSETVVSADGVFTTQPAGGEFALPDGRQWELVSPPNKRGALIEPLSREGVPIQASVDGGGITYDTNVPTEQGAQGYVSTVQVLSERGAQGWSSRDISPPRSALVGANVVGPEYYLFSGDLSSSLLYPAGEDTSKIEGSTSTLLSDRASENTPYVRRESLCDAPASASECYTPVLTGKEGFADVPPGTQFGGYFEHGRSGYNQGVAISGASPDMRHVVIETNFGGGIYEWSAGLPPAEALQLVNVLPEGEVHVARHPTVGEITESGVLGASGHAISDDGSRIVWVQPEESEAHAIYMRDMVRRETVRLDTPGPKPDKQFQIASSDGSRVFFTEGEGDHLLYECEIVEEAGKMKCDRTDLTPTGGVQRVLGASEDGSYVYFVANGVLGDGAQHGATQGNCRGFQQMPSGATCNLYEYHDGETTFIATLSGEDEIDWRPPARRTARVSPDGRFVAFMSQRSLTGYDNRDAFSGMPDMEVYLYDSLSRRLACASCNPTGSRPTGVEVGEFQRPGGKHVVNLVDVEGGAGKAYGGGLFGQENWMAANLPGGVGVGSGSLYQPRLLSDSGRVFFNSSDALVPQDVNGQEDVYQFEPVGVGSCSSSSQTFHESANGCTSLISSGASPEESGFMDASEGGGDVFFLTASRLTSQDYDSGLDVYDAQECSVSVRCIAQPVSAPPCSSGDSCKASPSPQPSIFGSPASATFAGAGNIVASPATGVVRGKSLTRAQKLASALKACGKSPKRKRAACEKQARKRYGARGARRATRATGKGQG